MRLVVFNRNTNANVYVNEVLANIVVLFMSDDFLEGNGILQQDGARPHTARVTQQFILDNIISILNWALMSVCHQTCPQLNIFGMNLR